MILTRRDTQLLSLFMAQRHELVAYATAIIGERSLAEDIVQDAYLRLQTIAGQPANDDGLEAPLGYLYRIVRNLALDGRRRMGREQAHIVSAPDTLAASIAEDRPSPEAQAVARDDLRLLQQALAELPERSRMALEMHRFGHLTFAEIAARLNVSIGTAHALVVQAVDHCKTRLAKAR